MKKSNLLIFFAIIAIILGFTFSTNKTTTKDNELVFWTLQMRDFSQYMENVIQKFETQNPEIKIKWVDVPFSEGEKRTLASILSNNPPDLINLNPDFSALLAEKGTLLEIDDKSLTQFSPQIISSLKIKNKNFLIPWYATSAITFSNTQQAPKTYNEILNICQTHATKPLIMFNFSENDSMLKLLNKYGITTASDVTSKTAIDLYKSLQIAYNNGCFPKESLTQTHRESLEKFMAGEISYFEGGANFLNIIKENAPNTYKNITLSSQLVGKTPKYNFSIMNFVIPTKSKKQDEALKFALFLTNEENQLELGKLTNVIATNKSTLNNPFYTIANNNDLSAKARILSAKQLKNIQQQQPYYKNRKELITLINNATQEILLNKNTIENVLTNLQADWLKLNQ